MISFEQKGRDNGKELTKSPIKKVTLFNFENREW
jgi:hypothetical protein